MTKEKIIMILLSIVIALVSFIATFMITNLVTIKETVTKLKINQKAYIVFMNNTMIEDGKLKVSLKEESNKIASLDKSVGILIFKVGELYDSK